MSRAALYRLELPHLRLHIRAASPRAAIAKFRKNGVKLIGGRELPPFDFAAKLGRSAWTKPPAQPMAVGHWVHGAGVYAAELFLVELGVDLAT